MKNPAQAIFWELWKTTRKELLLKFAYISALMSFLIIMPLGKDFSGPQQLVINGIIVLVIAICSASMSTCWIQLDNTNNGFVFRLGFTRPVSTRMLVLLPLLYTVSCAVISYVLPVVIGNIFLSDPVPIVGPAALVAAFSAGMLMATWSPATHINRFICLFLFAITFIAIVFLRHSFDTSGEPLLMALGRGGYYLLPWTILFAIVFVVVSWIVATCCVSLQRRGDRLLDFSSIRNWLSPPQSGFVQAAPFSSPLMAQMHYEISKSAKRVLLFAVFFAIAGVVFVTAGKLLFNEAQGVGVVWCGFLLLSPVVFQILASESAIGVRVKQGAVQYSVFDATRPFTNDQLIAIKLMTIGLVTFAGWLVVAAIAIPGFLLSVDLQLLQPTFDAISAYIGQVEWYWWLGVAVVLCLFYIVSGATMLAVGLWLPTNSKKLIGITGFLYLSMVLAFIDMASKSWSLSLLWEIYGYAYVGLVGFFLVRVFRTAIRDGSLATPLFLLSGGLWLIYATLVFRYGVDLLPAEKMPLPGILAAYASVFLPLVAILATPAALAQHRHR